MDGYNGEIEACGGFQPVVVVDLGRVGLAYLSSRILATKEWGVELSLQQAAFSAVRWYECPHRLRSPTSWNQRRL